MHDSPLGEARRRLWVVRDQVHGGIRPGVRADPLVGESLLCVVGPDAVCFPAEHEILRVRAVAREEDGVVSVLDENADLTGGVAGNGYERDVAGFGQAQALRERPNGSCWSSSTVGSNQAGQWLFAM